MLNPSTLFSMNRLNKILSEEYDTGRFIMFSVIINIYNRKTKGPTLMDFFIATGKLFFFQLEVFDVCTTGDTAHIDAIFNLLPHTRQHVDVCVATT
jgi:hypothetical protein